MKGSVPKKRSETDLATFFIKYLNENGYENVYKEVFSTKYNNSRPIDIVVDIRGLIHGVECKISLTLNVICQALYNLSYCNYSSICVFKANWKNYELITTQKILKQLGLGFYCVDKNGNVEKIIEPVLRRGKSPLKLYEEQKESLAGSKTTKRVTEFSMTCTALVNYVKSHEGCTLKEAVYQIKHHYSKATIATTCLAKMIALNVVKEIEFKNSCLFIRKVSQ